MATISDVRTATPDPPPVGIANPIHADDGATGAGYAGALVAGIRTYGWAAQTIMRALGPQWRTDGWVDFSLRRPLFSGEALTTTVTGDGDRAELVAAASGSGGDRVVLDGTAGVGRAEFADDIDPPPFSPGVDPPPVRPVFDLGSAPLREPLRPLAAYVKADVARAMMTDDLGIDDPVFLGENPPLHPFVLAGRMAPLTRHNFTFGPTIHVRSQIQHVGDPRSDASVVVGAHIVDAYDRNGHWYQVLDGRVTDGDGRDLALVRHHTIFRPRGTTPPPPITEVAGDR